MKGHTKGKEIYPLIEADMTLLAAHRRTFRQERRYQPSVGLLFGELFNYARHTVAQSPLTLGITDSDWSAWYRLFKHTLFDVEKLANYLLEQTVQHVPESEPYVAAIDGQKFIEVV